MKALAISMLALAMIGGAATAYAGNSAADCHSLRTRCTASGAAANATRETGISTFGIRK